MKIRTLLAGLLVAFLLFALLLGISYYGLQRDAQVSVTQATIDNCIATLQIYKQVLGRYPSQDEGLNALLTPPGVNGWKDPFIRGELPKDAWGNGFLYALDQGTPRLRSSGPDKKFHTQDDITN